MSFPSFKDIQWWHALFLLAIGPIGRAVAVVLLAKCVNRDIAKLAIPLVLRPMRSNIFPARTSSDDPSLNDSSSSCKKLQ